MPKKSKKEIKENKIKEKSKKEIKENKIKKKVPEFKLDGINCWEDIIKIKNFEMMYNLETFEKVSNIN